MLSPVSSALSNLPRFLSYHLPPRGIFDSGSFLPDNGLESTIKYTDRREVKGYNNHPLRERIVEKIHHSKITPEHIYYSRRKFLAAMGALAASTLFISACRGTGITPPEANPPGGGGFCDGATATASTDELGAKLTPCEDIISYNNYYEFSLSKTGVAPAAQDFKTSPWQVAVGGLVDNPHTYAMDEILSKFPSEERIYRMRCVEAWSMVIPWSGFPLAKLLNEAGPQSEAKYVRFETLYDPQQMPGQKDPILDWPYVEGLRLDEAMHDLTILATGIYGKPLPPQDGAPIRLVVPWKYGFKSIKSIVKIVLVTEMPVSAWMKEAPNEYGFYANVNPDVPHPRWSQATESRIGETGRIKTLLFNGYGDEVARLYTGMDLRKNF
jgi:sulfoxide reductase catalytic subunit YedY